MLHAEDEVVQVIVARALSRRANLAAINGVYAREFAGERPHLVFRYQVVRVWELPVQSLLEGGLSTLPLAPISGVDKKDLPHVIERMRGRLRKKGALGHELWAATYVLMGLRYERELINHLLRGVITMEESTTYQAIVEEGIAKGLQQGAIQALQRVLLRMGADYLGVPGAQVKAAVEAVASPERLEELVRHAPKASNWEDLLGLPRPRRRRGAP